MAPGFRKKFKNLFKRDAGQRVEQKAGAKKNNEEEDLNSQIKSLIQYDGRIESLIAGSLLGDQPKRLVLEARIRDEKLQRPGESMQDTVTRLQQEFVARYQDYEPEVPAVPRQPDRISDLIFTGRSDQPRTDGSAPGATASDRRVDFIENALETLFQPKLQSHQTIELDTTGIGPYAYVPLPTTRSIRLLHFHEDEYHLSPQFDTQKICTVEAFPLDDAPPYLALSYCWSAPRMDQETIEAYKEERDWIVLAPDQQHYLMKVGRNLYEALQRITKAKSSTRYIWIDAFCINQQDDSEKVSQVSFMDDIYLSCQRAVVWLGEMDPMAAGKIYSLFLDILPELVKYIQQHGANSIQTGDWTLEDLQARFGLLPRGQNWKLFCDLFRKHSWFTRAWVLQELALSPDAVFLFGHISLSFQEILLMSSFLSSSGLMATIAEKYDSENQDQMPPGPDLNHFNRMHQLAKGLRDPDQVRQVTASMGLRDDAQMAWKVFVDCIDTLRDMKSTMPQDRIFAALGFLQLDKRNVGVIVPDYKSPLRTLFTNITAMFLRKLPDLEILTRREDRPDNRVSDFPSWVPDYTVSQGKQPFHAPLYNAARGLGPPFPHFIGPGDKLVLHGRPFDTISAIHLQPSAIIESKDAQTLSLLHSGFNAVSHLVRTPGADPLDTLWRTLVANHVTVPGQPPIDASHFACFMADTLLDAFEQLGMLGPEFADSRPELIGAQFPSGPAKPHPFLLRYLAEVRQRVRTTLYPSDKDTKLLDTVAKKAAVFAGAAMRFTAGRQLFVTGEGLVGLGPASVKVGDKLLFIEGARLLFVGRGREGGAFELVGETYLHGCMDGELVSKGVALFGGDVVLV